MTSKILLATFTASLAVYGQWGGTETRRAEIRGGGGDGKCTIEVEVDDVAEVEIRGDTANLRTRSGQRAVWRRFVCNQVMPMRPDNFQFRGIDGRGRQELVRAPGNGGGAVIQIQDSKGGSEGYTFDVEWRGGSGGAWDNGDNRNRGNNGNRNRGNGNGAGWGNGNNGSGWNGAAGSTFNFRGDGNGNFNRRNGRDMRVRDVNVSLTRDGRVALSFDAQGYQRLNFVGRADRIEGNLIYSELRGSNTGGDTRGAATIYVDRSGEVERIEMTGRNNNDDFRLQWRSR